MHLNSARLACATLFYGMAMLGSAAAENLPIPVRFPSLDRQTMLVGYLFLPTGNAAARRGAIVMMHGRAGAYSSAAHGEYDAATLSKRHAFWGHLWADQGYVALLVDGFGPRGYPGGFPIHSYKTRPDAVNEVTVRPLDAYGALAYLQSRRDVDPAHVALQGWSNGGSATIATMSDATRQAAGLSSSQGFAGAVAFYPACTLHDRFETNYHNYAPLHIFSGDADEEVSAAVCETLVEHAAGGDLAMDLYPGATHDFDDPGSKRQSVPANAASAQSAIQKTRAFIADLFARKVVKTSFTAPSVRAP